MSTRSNSRRGLASVTGPEDEPREAGVREAEGASAVGEAASSRTWRGLLRGALWSGSGQMVARGSILLSGIVVARILSQEDYGKYGLLRSLVYVVVGFAAVGMGTVATRSMASFRDTDPMKAGRIAALTLSFSAAIGALAAVAMTLFAAPIAAAQFGDAGLASSVVVVGVATGLSTVQGTLSGLLVGLQALRPMAMVQVSVGVLLIPMVTLGAGFGGILGALVSLAMNQALLVSALFWMLRRVLSESGLSFETRAMVTEWRLIPRQAIPVAVGSLMLAPTLMAAQTLLSQRVGGFQELAVFVVAFTWGTVVAVPAGFFEASMVPMIARSGTDRQQLRAVVRNGGFMQVGVASAMAILVSLASPLIMGAHGEAYMTGVPVLVVICGAYLITYLAGSADAAISAAGNLWLGLTMSLTWSAVFLVAAIVWGADHGALGLAWCLLLAYLVKSVLQIAYLTRLMRTNQEEAHSLNERGVALD